VTVRPGRIGVEGLTPAVLLDARTLHAAARLARRQSLGPLRALLRGGPLWRADGERIIGDGRRGRPGRPGRLGRLGRELRLVVLDVDESERFGDWEFRLAASLPEAIARTIVFARLRGPRSETPPTPLPTGDCDPAAHGRFLGPRHLRPPGTPAGAAPGAGIAHAIGTPVRTTSGLRLRVSDGEAGPTGAGDGILVGIENLDVGGARLTILQADPVDGPAQPLGDDRAGFVDLAIAALDAGAAAVLVLPPLPDGLAADVATTIRATAGVAAEARLAPSVDARRALSVLAARAAKEVIHVAWVDARPGVPDPTSRALDPRAGDDVLLFLR